MFEIKLFLLLIVLSCQNVMVFPFLFGGENGGGNGDENGGGESGAVLSGLVGDLGDTTGDLVGDLGDTAGDVVGDLGDATGDVVGNVGDATGDLVGDVGGATGDIVGGDIGEAAGGLVGGIGDVTGDVVGDLGDTTGDLVRDLGDTAGDVVGDLGDTTGDLVEDLGDTAEDLVGDLGDATGDVVGDLGDATGDLVGDVGEATGDIVGGDIGEAAGGLVGGIGDVTGDVVGDLGDTTGDLVGDLGDTAEDLVGDLGDTAGDLVGDLGDVTGDLVGDVVDLTGDVVGEVLDGLTTCDSAEIKLGDKTAPFETGIVLVGLSATVECLPTYTVEIDGVLTDDSSYKVKCVSLNTWDSETNKGYDCKRNPCFDYCQNGGNCTNEGFQASCACESGWGGDRCTDDVDECASSPCLNKGQCEQLPFAGYQCVCLSTFTGDTCDEQIGTCGLQTSGEKAASASSMTISTIASASIIIGLIFILVIFIIMQDVFIARVYHMIQELSLLLAHGILIWGRTTTVFDTGALCDAEKNPDYQAVSLSPTVCKIVAIVLHYAFLVFFVSLMLEALHNYIVYTMVLNKKSLLNRFRLLTVAVFLPVVPVILTAIPLHNSYTNDNTCWLNFGTINAVIELAPICILAALTVIVSEATSMRKFAENKNADTSLRTSSITNSRGTLIMAPLGMGAWLTGVLGVYDSSLFFNTVAAGLNIALLVVIIMFHTGGNAKARALVKKMCCCCGK